MKFPQISDVVSKSVVKIDIKNSIEDAVEKMYDSEHRNVVVEDGVNYYILTASDILQLKLKNYNFKTPLNKISLRNIPTINYKDNILDTIEYLDNPIEYICAVDDNKKIYGILTHTDIISNIDPETLMENYRIGDLINMNKHIQKCDANSQTSDILSKMVQNNYDCIVIVDKSTPVGIITTKDIMQLLKNGDDLLKPISVYMSSPIQALNENASIKEAINFMKEKHFKRVIITNKENQLVGLILQRELISLSYSRWSILMKQYSNELYEINSLLEKKNEKYEKMATTDPLTGLYNRYKFAELFVSEYDTMVKRGNSMSLFMMDIDFFKSVNDTYGHNVGDKILLQVSNLLLRYLRNVDIVGRWGGEEFVALLPTATLENAVTLTNKIRKAIEEFDMANHIKITASFGITEVKAGDELTHSVDRADKALYEAKDSGRNCVKSI